MCRSMSKTRLKKNWEDSEELKKRNPELYDALSKVTEALDVVKNAMIVIPMYFGAEEHFDETKKRIGEYLEERPWFKS